MNLSFYIAKRYLFTKKSHNVINVISAISVCGVALATMALICTLSVFNGFSELVSTLFTTFDPDLKITATQGKYFKVEGAAWNEIKKMPQIAVFSSTVEDKAMVQYKQGQVMVTIKGVEDNFDKLTQFKSILVGNGEYRLHDDVVNYAIPGVQVSSALGCGLYFVEPLEVYAPRRGGKLNLSNPNSNFNREYLYSSGLSFLVNQEKYDASMIVTSLEFAQELFLCEPHEVSAVELKIAADASCDKVKEQVQTLLGDKFAVKDRYEQQEDVFRIMRIEKFISYIFLSFILMIACFNVIGSLSMLIIDKKKDVIALRNLGASDRLIARIFLLEGGIISVLGAFIGIILGVTACLLQEHFGLITFGNSAGSFVVDAYPVALYAGDLVVVFFTVILVGFLSMWLPVKHLTKKVL